MSGGIKLDPQVELRPEDSQLEGLTTLIRQECERSMEAARTSLDHALRAGEYLLQAKERISHGQWMSWLAEHCQLNQRVANNYMRLARHQQEVSQWDCTITEALNLLRPAATERAGPGVESVELEAERSNWQRVSIGAESAEQEQPEVRAAERAANWNFDSNLGDPSNEAMALGQEGESNWNFDSILELQAIEPAQETIEAESNWNSDSILELPPTQADSEPPRGRKARIQNDFYETAEGLTRALLRRCPELTTAQILEPCAGEGAIARLFPNCLTNDVDPLRPCDYALDATDPTAWSEFGTMDWVVTNPPFSHASQILPLALEHACEGVAFLLRLTYLEPCSDRADWLLQHADQMRFCLPCNPRPQFRQDTDSTDSATVAWLIWLKDWSWTRLGLYPPFDFITHWR